MMTYSDLSSCDFFIHEALFRPIVNHFFIAWWGTAIMCLRKWEGFTGTYFSNSVRSPQRLVLTSQYSSRAWSTHNFSIK
jgi:hypothetical protein